MSNLLRFPTAGYMENVEGERRVECARYPLCLDVAARQEGPRSCPLWCAAERPADREAEFLHNASARREVV